MSTWDQKRIDAATKALSSSYTIAEALNKLGKKGRTETLDSIAGAFRRVGLESPSFYLKEGLPPELDPISTPPKSDAEVLKLIQALKKKDCTLRYLCDEVFMSSPKKVEDIVAKAKKAGVSVHLKGDELGFRPPEVSKGIATVKPKTTDELQSFQIGVISDIHFGSLYCLEDAVTEHVETCYKLGIREILIPGDILEGCYKHARFELSAVRWEDQAAIALKHLPAKPGLTYHFIDGNHDYTYTDQIGLESGRSLVRLANEHGRKDLIFYGSRGARLDYAGTVIEMWHPKKGMGYSKSYVLQNHIRDTNPAFKPHILLVGHHHQFIQFQQTGVYTVACGTFQHSLGPFGKSLGGDTAVGGIILKWSMCGGKVVKFSAEHCGIDVPDPHFTVIPST